jgi:hypothetical protein
MGVGSCRENAALRAFEFRRRDHFHGFGDFLGFLNGGDLSSDGLKAGHVGYTYLFTKEEDSWGLSANRKRTLSSESRHVKYAGVYQSHSLS